MSLKIKFSRKDIIGSLTFAAILTLALIFLKTSKSGELGPAQHEFSLPSESAASFTANEPDASSEDEQLTNFYPNEINQDEWQQLGFSEKQAASIINYRENYGPFEKAQDIQKIYVVSDEKYQELKPFMVFRKSEKDEVSNPTNASNSFNDYDKKVLQIDINAASTEELTNIHGIGETYANRITKFRNLLGGFYSKDQFSEVYGLADESLESLKQNTVINNAHIQKIDINQISKSQLKKHPYFKKWEVVTAILQERETRAIKSLDFLIEQSIIIEAEAAKMLPYVSFE